jgi:hypothetical protein
VQQKREVQLIESFALPSSFGRMMGLATAQQTDEQQAQKRKEKNRKGSSKVYFFIL